jgi:hypothetical protein
LRDGAALGGKALAGPKAYRQIDQSLRGLAHDVFDGLDEEVARKVVLQVSDGIAEHRHGE